MPYHMIRRHFTEAHIGWCLMHLAFAPLFFRAGLTTVKGQEAGSRPRFELHWSAPGTSWKKVGKMRLTCFIYSVLIFYCFILTEPKFHYLYISWLNDTGPADWRIENKTNWQRSSQNMLWLHTFAAFPAFLWTMAGCPHGRWCHKAPDILRLFGWVNHCQVRKHLLLLGRQEAVGGSDVPGAKVLQTLRRCVVVEDQDGFDPINKHFMIRRGRAPRFCVNGWKMHPVMSVQLLCCKWTGVWHYINYTTTREITLWSIGALHSKVPRTLLRKDAASGFLHLSVWISLCGLWPLYSSFC